MLNLIHGITIGLLVASAVLFFNPPEPQIIYQCSDEQVRKEALSRLQIALNDGYADIIKPMKKPRG